MLALIQRVSSASVEVDGDTVGAIGAGLLAFIGMEPGDTDAQIARIFQRSIGLDAALGGLVGMALGGAAIWLLGRQFAGLGSGMVAGGELGPVDWVLLAAIPVIGVIVAILTARLTVLSALRRML